MSLLQVSEHPLVAHKVTRLRDKTTSPQEFRALIGELAGLLGVQATADMSLRPCEVETPMQTTTGHDLAERLGLVPILRAGLGMVPALHTLLPTAEVWHLGLYRDEQTLSPVEYYNKLPPNRAVDLALVLDPMLATGGSAIAAIDVLVRWGVPRIKFLGILGAPEGVTALHQAHPGVEAHLCQLDERLNEKGYILPGLGDAGDRMFDTT